MKIDYAGHIEDGKLTIYDRQGFDASLQHMAGRVRVLIEYDKGKRSQRQNRYLWGVVYKLLAEYTGHDKGEIHDICKIKFLRKEVHIGDEDFSLGKSTTKLSTIEFETYAEEIRRWGATLGVVIPEPNQKEWIDDPC